MAFEGLASKLQETLKKLKGKGKLTEKDIINCKILNFNLTKINKK